jgi:putative SOS response-associated peptidase YedK
MEDALIRERFGIRVTTAVYKARYNCAPVQNLAVITDEHPDQLQFFRWGLVPGWSKDDASGAKMINARAETVAEKPSFRNLFRNRRCLVPATGFYEWRRSGGKTPFHIRMKGGLPFVFAGLWDKWNSPEGSILHTFTIITTTPNELMTPIHDRMPVILERRAEEQWLTSTNPTDLLPLLRPFDASLMEAFPVATLVNSPRNDNPEILNPAAFTTGSQGTLF